MFQNCGYWTTDLTHGAKTVFWIQQTRHLWPQEKTTICKQQIAPGGLQFTIQFPAVGGQKSFYMVDQSKERTKKEKVKKKKKW